MSDALGSKLFKQDTDLEIIQLLLPYIDYQTFLDIGAEKGEFTRAFSQRGLKGIFFEPLPQCVEELTLLAKQTNCIFSTYAIDEHDRTADFYHAYDKNDNDAQHFSSLHPLENDDRINHKKITTVQCRSLNSLLKEGLISQHIGVIKIDTEGNDLNVLKGMNEVTADVLMCEYFMPQIYSGWELGHPHGLIKQAKQLGFNHFIAIKRIHEYEFISLDNNSFMDKQWGNLIFIADKTYNKAMTAIHNYINQKEVNVIQAFLDKTEMLQHACNERLDLIERQSREMTRLTQICEERLKVIEQLNKLKQTKNWFKKLKTLVKTT